MLRATLIALSLVAGAVVVVFGYSYVRGGTMTHVDPPAWLWLTAAAAIVLGVGALMAMSRFDRGNDGRTPCPKCGARIDWAAREGLHSPPDEPWLLLCDRCEAEVRVDV